MKILFCEISHLCHEMDWEGKYLAEKIGKKYDSIFFPGLGNDYDQSRDDFEVLCTFIHTQVNEELLNKMPKLKLVVTRSTGFDHIDLDKCRERGIEVCNVPFYGENTVAEYAFSLLNMLARKMYEAYDRVIRGNYSLEGLMGFDLKGKTLGVIGGGHIGIHAAQIGVGYDMKVLCYDVKPDSQLAKRVGFEYVELDDLYARADIITLHVPLIPPTQHMINQEAFAKMKDGVILINTARGGVVDTGAMVAALASGKLAGAGLDVMEAEEFLSDEVKLAEIVDDSEKLRSALENHILMEHPRVVVTFHNAFNTVEGRTRILDTSIENIMAFETGPWVNSVIKK
ncbi:MAG: NAD(P)-dependent oxidoreductase [Patescibacteria group bacterium]